jgi:hypothetical protein
MSPKTPIISPVNDFLLHLRAQVTGELLFCEPQGDPSGTDVTSGR